MDNGWNKNIHTPQSYQPECKKPLTLSLKLVTKYRLHFNIQVILEELGQTQPHNFLVVSYILASVITY